MFTAFASSERVCTVLRREQDVYFFHAAPDVLSPPAFGDELSLDLSDYCQAGYDQTEDDDY